MKKKHLVSELAFEDTLSDEWGRDLDVVEVPLSHRTLLSVGIAVGVLGVLLLSRTAFLNFVRGEFYGGRARANATFSSFTPAPRGAIYDRNGEVLAEDVPSFSAVLDMKAFLERPADSEHTLDVIETVLGIAPDEVRSMLKQRSDAQVTDPLVLHTDLTQAQLVQIEAASAPGLYSKSTFQRKYPWGSAFSHVVGYANLVSAGDLEDNPSLLSQDIVGKSGVEAYYDKAVRGAPGADVATRDAKGNVVRSNDTRRPVAGSSLRLTIDAQFQRYFFERMRAGLQSLGRTSGVGLAMNPRNGEVLALFSMPSFDNNLFVAGGRNDEKRSILASAHKPLFNRAVSGAYTPGSTIKPLVAVAALKEGVIDARREIFSPGYLEVPNPYDPEHPSRYLDWRPQGNVNAGSAIAQSSNVYFYVVGGGTEKFRGLGVARLRAWWEKFGLGQPMGIDLPSEAAGFLPDPEWKEKETGTPWLLGDTYNVSIGQGDLLLNPLQLLSYIASIANGGKVYRPFVALEKNQPTVIADLSEFISEIREVQKGMRLTVTSPLGTAHLLSDLAFPVAAKTGSAQIRNNAKENAFFVGYAPAYAEASAGKPAQEPQIAVLVLVEESREGSLNAVPIGKDVLDWYYWNRIRK
jgi:penicillin-binding protein 2